VKVEGSGPSSQACAIRLAAARALAAFMNEDMVQRLRLGVSLSVFVSNLDNDTCLIKNG